MRAEKIDKVILNSVVSTLLAIVLLAAIAFGLAAWLYPSTMMQISYEVGNDTGAMKYAYRAYERTDEVYYLAYATEVAIGMDDNEDIEYYAEKFVADENFTAYCAEMDAKMQANGVSGSYRQYVYGKLVVAEYERGAKTDSKTHAKEAIGAGFAENNAMVALLLTAMEKGDVQTVGEVVTEMQNLQLPDGADKTYLSSLLSALEKLS